MDCKPFEPTGEIKAEKNLTPGVVPPVRLVVDDAGGHTVKEIGGVTMEVAEINPRSGSIN